MALSFLKKVFTFGKDKPVEDAPAATPAADAVMDQAEATFTPAETRAIEAELEPHSRSEDLPLANDPVLPEGMDTAGGPSADTADTLEFETETKAEEDEPSAILPAVEEIGDIGLVPLSLLEAEAEASEVETSEVADAEIPPSVPEPVLGLAEGKTRGGHLPLKGGDQLKVDEPLVEEELTAETAEATADLISPLEGEMPGRAEGGEPATLAEATDLDKGHRPTFSAETDTPIDEVPATPALPKGFATGRAVAEPVPEAPKQKLTWFQRLRQGLARTSSQLTGQITALFTKRKLDDETLQDLEDLLIQADLGVETALRVTDTLASERYGKDVTGEDVTRIMATEITKVLAPVAKPLQLDLSHKPHVILVVGVNGTGKTTTIGKLAAKLSGAGLKVMLAAGDTFRAAAIEQLKIWAERTKSDIVSSKLGADAAGLAYEAFEQARLKKSDVLIIDTAGRLQNRTELMAELEKIVRVLGKLDPDAPHTVLQTLDATTGQNALNQVEIFRNVAGVNGLIMTKLDGTARGGILVAISAKHKLPVYFIGVGEGVDDLEPFEAKDFAEAIAGIAH
ncbi:MULTISPECIES: signal recognition particle-docking protein FtsY [unclassified Rhizobium]|uniref:signal recognition particle-docking protein FtsY n=1 Tax=unclassified Rhizobium TaxID=2613769 RepID=UPI0007138729|nr:MULTISPECIES: signal recognition particle-docking protein FtsY [unclassified Rhizobium]KQS87707.1 signal recognition particle-docking protein FtsY [Rhizobium sp. Leaf391]KQT07143.1 signal recognition particle-docking protein FtsY [Rhizobium sp. Leaf386]KQT95269.1 signal recognition particle-docking protein FtsY [Rhizobium sp. Leaf453]